MTDPAYPTDWAVRRQQWEEYLKKTFGDGPDSEPPHTSERIEFRPGSVLAMPLSPDDDSLPAGFYILLTEPDLPVVTLCIAGRDSDGYLCTTDNRIHVERDRLHQFKPVAGLRLF